MTAPLLTSRRGSLARRRAAAGITLDTSTLGGGTHYLNLTNTAGQFASTPHVSGLTPATSDTIDLRAKLTMVSWVPSGNRFIIAKWGSTATDVQYGMFVDTAGKLNGVWYRSGGTYTGGASTVSTGLAANAVSWVRVVINPAGGTSTYYLSSDGTTWNALGTTVSATAGAIQTPATFQPLTVGSTSAGTGTINGKVYAAQVIIGGTLTYSAVDFSVQSAGATSFIGSNGETWAVQGTAAIV